MTKQEEVMLMELDWSKYKICSKCGMIKRKTDYYKGYGLCKPCKIKQTNERRKIK